ncbi:MAG: TrmH family RNA methyltransferase [Saccharofermentanales bacterium]|jgi:TrmH family RNA methyltransferase
MRTITSSQNPLYKTLYATATSPRSAKKNQLVLVEGLRHVEEALCSGVHVQAVFFSDDEAGRGAYDTLKSLSIDVDHVQLPLSLFSKVSQMKTSQGVLALARPMTLTLDDFFLNHPDAERLLFLEDVQDPGNVGTLIRTADAFSFDGVVVAGSTASIWNPKTSAAAMGSLFHISIVQEEKTEAVKVLETLKAKGFVCYAAALEGINLIDSPEDKSRLSFDRVTDEILTESCIAIMLGNEGNGLSNNALQHADSLVRIPMTGRAESLNVASAGTILLWEAYRRRCR